MKIYCSEDKEILAIEFEEEVVFYNRVFGPELEGDSWEQIKHHYEEIFDNED